MDVAKFDSGAVYVGDVCWRDDDGPRRQVVVHVAPGGSSTTVHLADCGPSPSCMYDTKHRRGELCSHGPGVLRARRHATPEEMAFAWEKFLPHRDDVLLGQDRCHRCYTEAHSALVSS